MSLHTWNARSSWNNANRCAISEQFHFRCFAFLCPATRHIFLAFSHAPTSSLPVMDFSYQVSIAICSLLISTLPCERPAYRHALRLSEMPTLPHIGTEGTRKNSADKKAYRLSLRAESKKSLILSDAVRSTNKQTPDNNELDVSSVSGQQTFDRTYVANDIYEGGFIVFKL